MCSLSVPSGDAASRGRRRRRPAATNGTQGPAPDQHRGRGQEVWPGEEAEPQGLAGEVGPRLSSKPRLPASSRRPSLRWNAGREREVRGRGGGARGTGSDRGRRRKCEKTNKGMSVKRSGLKVCLLRILSQDQNGCYYSFCTVQNLKEET